jgi:hypothetical protein
MTAGLEVDVAEEFIFDTLTGDATLMGLVNAVVNSRTVPQTVPFPFVQFFNSSAIDYAAVGAARIWTDQVYTVKVVGHTALFSDLKAAAARIDTLLHRGSGPTADGTVWSCVREQIIRQEDDVSGDPYRHSGGLYRIQAS